MRNTTSYPLLRTRLQFKKPGIWIGATLLLIGLTVFQDYLFSRLQHTGFYISESLLYNNIWVFLIPFGYIQVRLADRINLQNKVGKLGVLVLSSGVLTILHIVSFATLFVIVSHFAFSPTHRFSNIFNGALSNQFVLIFLFYSLLPVVITQWRSREGHTEKHLIKVKMGLKTIALHPRSIVCITTEKPYTVILTPDRKMVDNRTLKEFETLLDADVFIRVHRSAIINKRSIKELVSRKNGDYDAHLESGDVIRLSRHYRSNWDKLLQ